ncbi:DUF397 domain-containing protein [Streptomyces sp. NPDC007107]|uniref:DUF397 domain-containing protein n=1 Tax=Streptomyces sp. NPDC007107 TaxID=3156915 RepID=UPI0034118368
MTRTSNEVPESAWFKSSYSGGNETECVEAAFDDAGASVRDSTRPHEGRFHVRSAAWSDFVGSLRSGQLR